MAKATAVRVSTGKKFSQLLIITPAVAIDSNEHDDYRGPFNSSSLDSGCGGSSEGSLSDDTPDQPIGSDPDRRRRRRHSGDRERQQQGTGDQRNNNAARLLPLLGRHTRAGDAPSGVQAQSSGTAAAGWRWCGLICSAVKCFRAAATATGTSTSTNAGAKQRGGPFGAGSTIRYTSAGDGTDQQHHQTQQPQQYQYDAASPFAHTRTGGRHGTKPRFSSDRVYEYTIKSYRHPQRDRRSRSRSASVSSELSAISTATGAVATTESTDHDHINNNTGTGGSGSNGNILLSSTLLPGSSGTIIVTTTTSEEDEEETIGGTAGVHDRKNIMYKL
ncbi:hypothetical protein AND_005962 [Anopheles darlingi]|uniref:Uncharacterized protein n=2 Tax=Anopheles darlingi TaxID=43151 RepID=W5JDB6_ANODA|nr:hypothetical protein AND_005962 [Anopheles darlingi]